MLLSSILTRFSETNAPPNRLLLLVKFVNGNEHFFLVGSLNKRHLVLKKIAAIHSSS